METESFASGNPVQLEYAKFMTRVLATLIDVVLMMVPGILMATSVPYVGWLMLLVFYSVALECSPAQATIGKRVMGIKVVSKNGDPISVAQAFIRKIMSTVSSSLLGLGHLLALFTEKRQALQDIVADTYVVVGTTEMPIPDAWISGIRRIFGIR